MTHCRNAETIVNCPRQASIPDQLRRLNARTLPSETETLEEIVARTTLFFGLSDCPAPRGLPADQLA
jgi:hypothetical protein